MRFILWNKIKGLNFGLISTYHFEHFYSNFYRKSIFSSNRELLSTTFSTFRERGGAYSVVNLYFSIFLVNLFYRKSNSFLHFHPKIQCVLLYETKTKFFLKNTNQALPTSCRFNLNLFHLTFAMSSDWVWMCTDRSIFTKLQIFFSILNQKY